MTSPILINSYTLNDQGKLTKTSNPDFDRHDTINAYYIEDQWASNIDGANILKILESEQNLDSLNSFASSLFCDDTSLYVFQSIIDAKYEGTSSGFKSHPLSFNLRRITLGLPQSTVPTAGTPYIYNGTAYFAVVLDINQDSGMQYTINYNPAQNNKIKDFVADDILPSTGNIRGYRFYANQTGISRPDCLLSGGGLVSGGNAGIKNFENKNSGYSYGYMNGYWSNNKFYYIHSSGGSNDIDTNVNGKNFCEIYYNGATVRLSLFGSEKQNYFTQKSSSLPTKEGEGTIENSRPDFKVSDPFALNKNGDGVTLKFFTKELHGKKLQLRGGKVTDYLTLFYKLSIADNEDGNGTWVFRISNESTLDLSSLKDDAIFDSLSEDLCCCSLESNSTIPKVVELNSKSSFIYKIQTSTTAVTGYSDGIIYSAVNQSMLIPTINTDVLAGQQYDYYMLTRTYNDTNNFFKDYPVLTQDKIIISKYDALTNQLKFDETNGQLGALPVGVADNLLTNSYFQEYSTINRYTFTPTVNWVCKDRMIPLVAYYTGTDKQILNSEIFTLAVLNTGIGIESVITSDKTNLKIGNNINLVFKVR